MLEAVAEPHTVDAVTVASTSLGDVRLVLETKEGGAQSLVLLNPIAAELLARLQEIFSLPAGRH